jgi:tetratricopeptide (TPR) repeat protein
MSRLLIVLLAPSLPPASSAQTSAATQELKQKADALVKEQRVLEALPLLEQLVVQTPSDAEVHSNLAFALLAQAAATKDSTQRAKLRIRARNEFIRAKELGEKHPILDAMIQGVPADGADAQPFSENKQANDLMNGAEAFFSQGKFDDALATYQQALQVDPKLYHAALFSGDVYMQRGDFAQAEAWYQKAIGIDPSKEVAYRYSATPLMKQGKYELARDRYVESYIREPYSRFAIAGLTQWAEITKTKLAHPAINIPTDVTFDEKGDAKINLDAATLLGGKNDGSFAWVIYGGTRSLWHKTKFAEKFPQEKQYRHSLDEETDALRSVLSLATGDKKVKTLSSSLAKLKELNDKGLLEAYILLAHTDEGIAVDYPGYFAHNSEKVRQYVVEYVLGVRQLR